MTGNSDQWFRRLGDIPDLQYNPPQEAAAAARSHPYYSLQPNRQYGMSWQYPEEKDSWTSEWPAPRYFNQERKPDLNMLVWRLYAALEFPADPAAYHFIIHDACSQFWKWRGEELDALQYLEYFAELDLTLNEKFPEILHIGSNDFVARLTSLELLIRLYLTEGAYGSARSVIIRGEGIGQSCKPSSEELEQYTNAVLGDRAQ